MDPRADNCRAFRVDGAGLVRGVELVVAPKPGTPFELVRAELIDEAAAGGNTVASCTVLDEHGAPMARRVWLAWVFPGLGDGKLLPGNPEGSHMVTNGYDAARGEKGPLGLYVGDDAGNVLSDVIGGVGLPNSRHVCYSFVWRVRGSSNGDPDPGTGGEDTPSLAEALALGRRAVAALERLVEHFGA